jgi:4,5-dihydroxyphthalate decarboxylase
LENRLRLRVTLGKHDYLAPLRDGRVTSRRVELEFVEVEPLPRTFREMVRGNDIDVSEMAIITHLLAHHFGKPLTGLAIPLWNRLPHTNLVCRTDSSLQHPSELNGCTLGVRSYAQTSGVWVRGVLADDYGVDNASITWGTMEDAHLAEFVDPSNTRRYTPPPSLRDLLLDGEFAAIMGERIVDPSGIRTVIPDAERAAQQWIAREGINPINHTVAIRNELLDHHGWLAEELVEMFKDARDISLVHGVAAPLEYGFAACRHSLQRAFDYAADQLVTPQRYRAEDLYLSI